MNRTFWQSIRRFETHSRNRRNNRCHFTYFSFVHRWILAEALELTTAAGKMFIDISGGEGRSYVLHEGQATTIVD